MRQDQTHGAEERAVYVVEFGAYHMDQIDKKRGRVIELLEQSAAVVALIIA